MKKIITIFIWFLISTAVNSGQQIDGIPGIIDKINEVTNHSVENYPPAIETYREEVSKYYNDLIFSKAKSPPPHWAAILLTLNHTIGIETVLQEYYDRIDQEGSSLYDNQFALASHAQESVLPYIYENVYHGSNLHGFRRDANLLVLHIIKNSKRFPEESRKWAEYTIDRMLLGPTLPYTDSILSQIKDWLYNNREAILDERYEEATWLPAGPPTASKDGKETPDPKMALLPLPVVTKLVKAIPTADDGRPSKARLVSVAEFYSQRTRQPKRLDYHPSKVDTPELDSVSWGMWLVSILLLVLVTLSWNALRKSRLRAR